MCAISAMSSAAHADVRDVVNELRRGGCATRSKLPALNTDARLQGALKQIINGVSTENATQAMAYPTMQLSTIRLSGYMSDGDIRQLLKAKYCPLLMQPEWQDIASERRGEILWIVLAVPHAIPADDSSVARQVLTLVNAARAEKRLCGSENFSAAKPLNLNSMLSKAAQLHAEDMARHQQMQHEGSDGSSPAQRVTRQGYRWKAVGENVAAGAGTAAEVVAGWLHSPGHCANIMNPVFTEMGIAYAVNQRDEYAVYWAQEFATPR
jgi:uncharacterized protein YkwD